MLAAISTAIPSLEDFHEIEKKVISLPGIIYATSSTNPSSETPS